MSDSPELLKPDTEVTDGELQISIGNLQVENETLKADYATLLESSAVVTNNLRQEVQKLRSQLETERAIPSVTASPKFELPEPADLLNHLKAQRKKSTVSLADMEVILGILEES